MKSQIEQDLELLGISAQPDQPVVSQVESDLALLGISSEPESAMPAPTEFKMGYVPLGKEVKAPVPEPEKTGGYSLLDEQKPFLIDKGKPTDLYRAPDLMKFLEYKIQEDVPAIQPGAPGRELITQEKEKRKPIIDKGFFTAFKQSAERGMAGVDTDIKGFDAILGTRKFQDVLNERQELADLEERDPVQAKNIIEKGLFGLAQMAPAMVKGEVEGIPVGAMAAGATVLTGLGAPAAPAAFLAGMQAGAAQFWYRQGAGNVALNLVEKGIDPTVAKVTGLLAGAPYAAIEFSQVGKLIPGLDKELIGVMTNSIVKNLGAVAAKYGTNWMTEVGEEGLQQIITDGSEEVAKAIDGKQSEKGISGAGKTALKVLKNGMDAATQVALTMMFMFVPKGGLHTALAVKEGVSQKVGIRARDEYYKKMGRSIVYSPEVAEKQRIAREDEVEKPASPLSPPPIPAPTTKSFADLNIKNPKDVWTMTPEERSHVMAQLSDADVERAIMESPEGVDPLADAPEPPATVETPSPSAPEAPEAAAPPAAPTPAPMAKAAPQAQEMALATQEMPGIDNLTGLPNANSIRRAVAAAEKDPSKTVFMFDIDKFKAINDVHGHGEGDMVLSAIGKTVRENFADIEPGQFGRMGGEEFAVILPNTPESVQKVAEFLKIIPRDVQVVGEPVTISGGIGQGRIKQQGGGERNFADKLLYDAKSSGRNQLAIDKNGKTEYIKGERIGEKKYATKYTVRAVAEGARDLLNAESISAPEVREQLERTVQALDKISGDVQGKADELLPGKPGPEVSVKSPPAEGGESAPATPVPAPRGPAPTQPSAKTRIRELRKELHAANVRLQEIDKTANVVPLAQYARANSWSVGNATRQAKRGKLKGAFQQEGKWFMRSTEGGKLHAEAQTLQKRISQIKAELKGERRAPEIKEAKTAQIQNKQVREETKFVKAVEATNETTRGIAEDVQRIIDNPELDNETWRKNLTTKFTDEQLNKAREAMKQGKKDGKAAEQMRKHLYDYFVFGYTEDAVVREMAKAGTPAKELTEAELAFSRNVPETETGARAFQDLEKDVLSFLSRDMARQVVTEFTDTVGVHRFNRGEEGAFWYDRSAMVAHIYINKALQGTRREITLWHEIIGHFGLLAFLKANPEINSRLTAIWKKEGKENSPRRARVDRLYPDSREEEQYAEWLAAAMVEYKQDYVDKGKTAYGTLRRIVELVRRLLVKTGMSDRAVGDVFNYLTDNTNAFLGYALKELKKDQPEGVRFEMGVTRWAKTEDFGKLGKPFRGPTGNELVAYKWVTKMGEKWSDYEGGMIGARVSDWDAAVDSMISNRQVVHQYFIKDAKTGKIEPHGIESAKKALGLESETRLKREAKRLMREQRYADEQAKAERESAERWVKVAGTTPVFKDHPMNEANGRYTQMRYPNANNSIVLENTDGVPIRVHLGTVKETVARELGFTKEISRINDRGDLIEPAAPLEMKVEEEKAPARKPLEQMDLFKVPVPRVIRFDEKIKPTVDQAPIDEGLFEQAPDTEQLPLFSREARDYRGVPVMTYAWRRNKEGGQKIGNITELYEVNQEIYEQDIKKLLRKGYADTWTEYINKTGTELAQYRNGELDGIETPAYWKDYYARMGEKGWAKKVPASKSTEAEEFRKVADSEAAPGQMTLFSRADQAGAGKDEVADARKEWEEKGTESKYFKKWFGESKVVDDSGEPLVVYHGTHHAGFTKFKADRLPWFYFSDNNKFVDSLIGAPVEGYQAGTYPVYLAIKNPVDLTTLRAKSTPISALVETLRDHGLDISMNDFPSSADLFMQLNNPKIAGKIKTGAEKAGYDGIVFNDFVGPVKGRTFIAFAPEQIKSATGNRGTFSTEEPSILFSRAERETAETATTTFDQFDVPAETWFQKQRRLWQDNFMRLKIYQKHAVAMTPASDPYRFQELYPAKAKYRLDKLEDDMVAPIIEDLGESDLSLKELDDFVYAQHAPERNAKMAEINPRFRPDLTLEGEKAPAGSGMGDEDAAKIIQAARDSGKYDNLARIAEKVRAINDFRLKMLEDEGLESADFIETLRSGYQNYVPLKGFEGDEEAQEPEKTGRGYDIRGKEVKRALGRVSRAASPVLNTILQAEATIIRAEKNKVGQSLLNFVTRNENKDLWEVVSRQLKPTFDENTGEVVYRQDPLFQKRPEVLSVKIKGKQYYIDLKDLALATAFKNLGADKANALIMAMATFNRYLAMVNTSLSPTFVATNMARDLQTALINISADDSFKLAMKTVKDVPAAVRGNFGALRGKKDTVWQKWFDEFYREGGKVEFIGLESVELKRKKLENTIRAMRMGGVRGGMKRMMKASIDLVMDLNGAVENASRVALYKNMREAGYSASDAASAAKNITVNFNRKGEYGKYLNAAYLFANAGIQGSARMLKTLSTPKGRKIAAGIVIGAFLIAELNRMIGGDDPDDDRNRYEKIDDWTKSHFLIIMRPDGKNPIKIPLAYGYNVFAAVGAAMSDVLHTGKVMKGAKAMLSAVAGAFNPLGSGNLVQLISPTIIDPIADLGLNRNYAGAKIMPEQKPYGPEVARSQLYFKSVSTPSRKIAEALNYAMGGSKYLPATVLEYNASISPEWIDYMAGYFGGGLARFILQTADIPMKLAAGETPDIGKVPFARQLVYQEPPYQVRETFYQSLGKIKTVRAEYEAWKKENPAEALKFKQEHAKVLRLETAAKDAMEGRDGQDGIEANRKKAQKYEGKNKQLFDYYQERVLKQMKQFNRVYKQRTE